MPMLINAQRLYDQLQADLPVQLEKLDARIKKTPLVPTDAWLELDDLRLTIARTQIMLKHLKELLDDADAQNRLQQTIIEARS